MKTIIMMTAMNEKNVLIAGPMRGRVSKEVNRLLCKLQSSSRTVVKSTLNEIRDLKNSLNRDLTRSYEVDQEIRARRDEILCKRLMAGGRML